MNAVQIHLLMTNPDVVLPGRCGFMRKLGWFLFVAAALFGGIIGVASWGFR